MAQVTNNQFNGKNKSSSCELLKKRETIREHRFHAAYVLLLANRDRRFLTIFEFLLRLI